MLILWSLTSHYMRKRYLCEERGSLLDAGFSALPIKRRVSYRDHPVRYTLFIPLLVHNSVIHRACRGRRLTKETTINMVNIYSPSSRSMSRRLALTLGLLLALLLSLPSYAQGGQSKEPINRTISGFTLGVTTPAEARAIIKRQGGEIEETQAWSDEVVYAITGLKYARRPTLSVHLYISIRGICGVYHLPLVI